jgi:uncharacterized integral membrane protein
MFFFLVLALAISMLAGFFALQNTLPIAVTFLLWTFEGSLALVLLVAFASGVLVSLLLLAPAMIKGRLTIARQNSEITELKRKAGAYRVSVPGPEQK